MVVQATTVVTLHHGSRKKYQEAENVDEMPEGMFACNKISAEKNEQDADYDHEIGHIYFVREYFRSRSLIF